MLLRSAILLNFLAITFIVLYVDVSEAEDREDCDYSLIAKDFSKVSRFSLGHGDAVDHLAAMVLDSDFVEVMRSLSSNSAQFSQYTKLVCRAFTTIHSILAGKPLNNPDAFQRALQCHLRHPLKAVPSCSKFPEIESSSNFFDKMPSIVPSRCHPFLDVLDRVWKTLVASDRIPVSSFLVVSRTLAAALHVLCLMPDATPDQFDSHLSDVLSKPFKYQTILDNLQTELNSGSFSAGNASYIDGSAIWAGSQYDNLKESLSREIHREWNNFLYDILFSCLLVQQALVSHSLDPSYDEHYTIAMEELERSFNRFNKDLNSPADDDFVRMLFKGILDQTQSSLTEPTESPERCAWVSY